MTQPDMHRPGSWAALFRPALKLMAHLEAVTEKPVWTFGGGTALMLRINHRQSKDIDLFVPGPQYLGYVNPRLSDAAESISDNYVEDAQFIKLFLPEGEIAAIHFASTSVASGQAGSRVEPGMTRAGPQN